VARLRAGRWLCVGWPEEHGGRGLSAIEVAALNEEFWRAGVPRVVLGLGEMLCGPALIVHGTEEQKATFLPRIIAGTDRYCQGFSEPDAGSDLASVRTRGEIDGDELVIHGQKVWTSRADASTMMFLLCRTDPTAPKHDGLSYVLVPMYDNSITIRPLRQLTGDADFYETFLDGARAPLTNVVGGLGRGWKVAMTTLGNERGGRASVDHLRFEREFWQLVTTARSAGVERDPEVRQALARIFAEVSIMRQSGQRLLAQLAQRREPGPEASVNKLRIGRLQQQMADLGVNLLGPAGLVGDADDLGLNRWSRRLLSSRAATIHGGTEQVQRNIVAERTLGLPRDTDAR
jgi:hypothetical protein